MKQMFVLATMMLLATGAARAACTLAQPSNMSLGTYTGTVSTSGAGTLTVTCTSGSNSYTIGLNAGTGSGATTSNRKLTGPASATLNYGLFHDAARTQNWGNTTGVDTASGQDAPSRVFTIYPRISASQRVAAGTYTDTISTGSRTFTITAVVQATCSISASTLNFGTYMGVQLDAIANLFVTCTNQTPYYVNLSDGLNREGAPGYYGRASGPSGVFLTYRLFRDITRISRWGNTYNVDGVAGTGSGTAQTLTLYGRVPAGQYVTPGMYSDTITATLSY